MRNIVFCAEEPQKAGRAPAHYLVALTADPAYRDWTTQAIPALRAQGRRLYAWCDCRPWLGSAPPGVPAGTPASEAIKLAHDYGLDGWIGQAESTHELEHALNAGATVIVGNASAWTEEQVARVKALVEAGKLAFVMETYTNVAGGWPDEYGARGVQPSSYCLGVYDASRENPGRGRYISVAEYKARTPAEAWPGVSVYHAAGCTDEDFRALPQTPPAPKPNPEPQKEPPVSLQLPRTFTPTHQTGGLPGYPAVDCFAAPGTVALAPEDGIIDYLSGRNPASGGSPGGSYGWSIYLTAKSGRYFMTHFGSRVVGLNQRVKTGDPLGTVCDSKVSGKPGTSHIHVGKKVAPKPPKQRKEYRYDVDVDGKRVNTGQDLANPKFRSRLIDLFKRFGRVVVTRRPK